MTVWAFQANRHGTAPFLAGPNSGKARSSCGGLRLVGIARDHGMAVDCLPILRTDIMDVKVHNIRQVLAYEATRADLRGVLGKIAGTQFANTGCDDQTGPYPPPHQAAIRFHAWCCRNASAASTPACAPRAWHCRIITASNGEKSALLPRANWLL